ncbi:MAG TPA: YihY/virulence factor BrkB family protein [Steroidobacteraceae bacterium]|jgi:membrane protein
MTKAVSDNSAAPNQHSRGRTAERPSEIPAKGWWDVLWRLGKRLGNDNISLVAGGVALYVLLSVFPGLAALVSIYGLFATPANVVQHMKDFASVLPPGVWAIFNTQLQELVHHSQRSLTAAAALGIVIALWSARSAMSALMTATNIAYGEREKRSFFLQIIISLVFTAIAILGFLLTLMLGVAIPMVLKVLGTSDTVQIIAAVLRAVLLWGVAVLGLAFIYRYAPAREHAQWRWVTSGSAIAATLWLAASALFAFYVKNFGGYGKMYGALGSVIALVMWFYISSFIVVVGAEANAEMERQTRKDSTVRRNAPLGQRGAYAADTVGPSAQQGAEAKAQAPAQNKTKLAGS